MPDVGCDHSKFVDCRCSGDQYVRKTRILPLGRGRFLHLACSSRHIGVDRQDLICESFNDIVEPIGETLRSFCSPRAIELAYPFLDFSNCYGRDEQRLLFTLGCDPSGDLSC